MLCGNFNTIASNNHNCYPSVQVITKAQYVSYTNFLQLVIVYSKDTDIIRESDSFGDDGQRNTFFETSRITNPASGIPG